MKLVRDFFHSLHLLRPPQMLLVLVTLVIAFAIPMTVYVDQQTQTLQQNAQTIGENTFSFNWNQAPTSPLRWVPGAVNDWDVAASNGDPSDEMENGVSDTDITNTMDAIHDMSCGAPMSTHTISSIKDAFYICNNHMMTAVAGVQATFTPNQLIDFSGGTAIVKWEQSTFRNATRDWADIWIEPYEQNLIIPVDDAPFGNGNPNDSVHITMDQRVGCNTSLSSLNDGSTTPGGVGTMWRLRVYKGGNKVVEGGGDGVCMEDAASATPDPITMSKVRTPFELQISTNHIKVIEHGAVQDNVLIDEAVNLSFNQGIITWGHRSYNASKSCGWDGKCGPTTWHWSNFSISPAIPFTILRPLGVESVHEGANTTATLPQPAPQASFLRFMALGNISISVNGGSYQLVKPNEPDTFRPEGYSSYFWPIPEGTTTIAFKGTSRVGGQQWWIHDVTVWSKTYNGVVAPTASPTPTQLPGSITATPIAIPSSAPTNTPTPRPTNTPTPTNVPTAPVSGVLLGDTSIESNGDSNKAGQAEAYIYTASATGNVSKLSVYLDPNSTTTQVVLGLYSDGNGKPGTLLTKGSLLSPGKGKWVTIAVPQVTVSAGVKYWIAILGPSGKGIVQYRDRASGGLSLTSSQTTLKTLPTTWSTGQTWSTYSMSAYASH